VTELTKELAVDHVLESSQKVISRARQTKTSEVKQSSISSLVSILSPFHATQNLEILMLSKDSFLLYIMANPTSNAKMCRKVSQTVQETQGTQSLCIVG
jgi:hypothetical protein